MINRVRAIRLEKGMTLAQVAAACDPPTTAQTIGRLETGMRSLSLEWMNRIAAALKVDPGTLLRAEERDRPAMIARLTATGAEALSAPREAVLPNELAGEARLSVLSVEVACGEYRAGDQIWLRETDSAEHQRLVNRDVLVPRPGGRFAFGRLIDRDSASVAVLPPGTGQRQQVVKEPAWVAVAVMLVRIL